MTHTIGTRKPAMAATVAKIDQFNYVTALFVTPLFLVAGTFFPISQLPDLIEPLAWLSPLWHGVEVSRGLALGGLEALPTLGHVGYLLLWVIVTANLMAMLIQTLTAKLGLATGRDLASLCRERFSRPVTWGLWLQAMKLAELRPAGVLHFSSYDRLITAAIDGQGVALGRVPLVASHLKSRKLVAPFSDSVVSPRCYFMVASASATDKPAVRAFMAWLQASARAPGSARRRDRARS